RPRTSATAARAAAAAWVLTDMGPPGFGILACASCGRPRDERCGPDGQAYFLSSSLNQTTSSKNLLGLMKNEIDRQPLGAWAMCVLPPGRHTKLPAVTLPCSSSRLPSRT